MLAQRLPYFLVYLSAVVFSAVVFYYTWRNRSAAGMKYFAWSVLLEISWLIGYFFELNSDSLAAKIFWDNFQYIGSLLTPVLLAGFAIEFTQIRIDTRRFVQILSIIPILVLLAIFSYQFPDSVHVNPQIEAGLPFDEFSYDFGPLSAASIVYLLLVAFGYLGILIAAFFRKTTLTRLQLFLVLLGTAIPILGLSLGLIFGWEFANQRDISPLMFALGNAVIAFGIFRFRLFNVIPIARQALFDSIDDLLIVLDNEDHVIDANPSALKVFQWDARNLQNASIEAVLPELYSQFKDVLDTRAEIMLPSQEYYELKITPIFDRSGNLYGRLISAHDITHQKKTEADLQRTNEQNRRRAAQFQVIAQVASFITSVQELNKTLTQVAETLSIQLGHYHVGIFLLDSNFQFAILAAANSDGGKQMLEQSYRIRIGNPGIITTAVTTGKPQISLGLDASKASQSNPFLPHTRSEITLPIRLQGMSIAILDIQSQQENAFSTDDLEMFEILASQVGIAIQNARLYEQNIQSLKDIEEAYQRLSGETWKNLLHQMDIRAYSYDGVTSRPLTDPQTGHLKSQTLSVPVTIRGKVVGNLRLQPLDPARHWTDDEIAIANAVADRAALALEGARLLEDAQKRASRESFLSDVASKLSTSFQLDSILRDTVEELGQSLSGSTVSFQLVNPDAARKGDKPNGHKKAVE